MPIISDFLKGIFADPVKSLVRQYRPNGGHPLVVIDIEFPTIEPLHVHEPGFITDKYNM